MRKAATTGGAPDGEQLVVDVLRLDRAEADALDLGLVEQPADEPARSAPPRGAPRGPRSDQPPSYVPMLMPVSTISRWPAASARRTSARTVSGEGTLGAAGGRDDAVGAEERAAVLDLDERAGPLGDVSVVHGRRQLDAGQRRERAATSPAGPSGIATSASSSASNPSLARLSMSRAAGSSAANASRPVWTEQPVTTISAWVHAARAAHRGARLGVGLGGDRARVDEDEVGWVVAADDGHALASGAAGPRHRPRTG